MRLLQILFLSFFSFFCSILMATPHIGYIYPSGGQRGTTFDITIGGQNMDEITGLFISGEGVNGQFIKILPKLNRDKKDVNREQENEQISERVIFTIRIDKKAKLGMRDLRIQTKNGFSNRLFFEVGELTETIEPAYVESIQPIATPFIANGQIFPGKTDKIKFKANKGETIVCHTKARALIPYLADAVPGWFQAVLTLKDKNGNEVAFNDDYMLSPDPVIIYKIPQTQHYTLEIRDAIYRGRADFVYRIAIGALPYVTSFFPLGGQKGKSVKVDLKGVNLTKNQLQVKIPLSNENKIQLSAEGNQHIASNSFMFATSNYREYTSSKKHLTKKDALPISLKTIMNGQMNSNEQYHWFKFEAERKEQIMVEVNARRLGSPLDAQITIFNSNNQIIAQNDDFADKSEGMVTHHADAKVIFKTWKTDTYYIRLRNLQGTGSVHHNYRLLLDRPKPDFSLRIEPSNLTINRGNTAAFTVHALRKNGFKGNIELDFKALPKGYTYSNNIIKKGNNKLMMTITAPSNAKLGILNLQMEGWANYKGERIVRKAEPAEELMQAFLYLHLLPAKDFLATVVPSLPYRISTGIENTIAMGENDSIRIKVKLDRNDNFSIPVRVFLSSYNKGIKAKPIVFKDDMREVSFKIETYNAKPGSQYAVSIKGIAKKAAIKKGKKKKGKKNKAEFITVLSPAFELEIKDD
ncbi:hypothetical protein E9993_12525 [Labilibacter sediminis]|nr:hypothetical protein E9993_12525 [Labilibacter sediminis]